jgi:hypothetical protein
MTWRNVWVQEFLAKALNVARGGDTLPPALRAYVGPDAAQPIRREVVKVTIERVLADGRTLPDGTVLPPGSVQRDIYPRIEIDADDEGIGYIEYEQQFRDPVGGFPMDWPLPRPEPVGRPLIGIVVAGRLLRDPGVGGAYHVTITPPEAGS